MNIFDRSFTKIIKKYRKMVAKEQEAGKQLVKAFEEQDRTEIENLINIVKVHGHPIQATEMQSFEAMFKEQAVEPEKIAIFVDLVEANRQFVQNAKDESENNNE